MPFVIECSDIPDIVPNSTVTLNFILDLFPARTAGVRRRFDARLLIEETPSGTINGSNDTFTFDHVPAYVYLDGVDETANGTIDGFDFIFDTPPPSGVVTGEVIIPIRSYQYTESETALAGELNVQLARISDKALIGRETAIKFQTANKDTGSWVWTTVVDTGKLASSDYSLANDQLQPNDGFSLTCKTLLESRLDESPQELVVLYDPNELTLSDEDFLNIPTIEGVENPVTLTPIADMMLHDVLEFIAEACGFTESAGVHFITNIPDFPLRRIDFAPGQPYWNGINGTIGLFEPQLDIDANDRLVIRDGTTDYQPTTSAAITINCSHIEQAQSSTAIERYQGTLLTYQEKGNEWDYYTFRSVATSRINDDFIATNTDTMIQEFFKIGFPNTPLFSHILKVRKYVSAPFNELAASIETRSYQFGQLSDSQKRVFARAKVPASWASYCAANGISPGDAAGIDGPENSYTGTDATYSNAFTLVRTERETFTYLAHPYEQDSVYLSLRESEQRGLITSDTANPQLEENFDQPIVEAQRAGNLTDGQDSYWGSTGYRWEEQRPLPNRQVLIRSSASDSLNVDSGEALLPEDYEDPRVGDIGIPLHKDVQHQVYITDGADESAKRWNHMHGGETPLAILEPLVKRVNRRQFYPDNVRLTVPGIDHVLTRGRNVDPKIDQRAEDSIGIFRIAGRTLTGNENGHRTELSARQIGAATITVEADTLQSDSYSIALESGGVRTIEIDITCWTGHWITGMPVSDVTVELKHVDDVSWTNIETTPYEVSAFSGEVETFQVRITAGTITSHLTRSFVLTVGPPFTPEVPEGALVNDDGDPVLNDDGDYIFV